MNIESQVCSLEFARRLKELGIEQSSLFYWIKYKNRSPYSIAYLAHFFRDEKNIVEELYSAFTVAELGEMLQPFNIVTSKYKKGNKMVWNVYVQDMTMRINKTYEPSHVGYTEADARAKMLIYLLENGLIKND